MYSSIFGYQAEATLVSHVTHLNRCVVLLSTEHYSGEIDEEADKKTPEIITHYNETKGGVDTLDRMAGEYTCQRMTCRWPMVLFMNMIDLAGVNAFVLWKDIHPEWHEGNESRRRLFLLELAKKLVDPMIRRRLNDPSIRKTQPTAMLQMMSNCLESISETSEEGEPATEPRPTTSSDTAKKRSRCYMCPRKNDTKVNIFCSVCKKFVCKAHRSEKAMCLRCE